MSLKELRTKFDAMKADMQAQMKVAFVKESMDLFNRYPDMRNFSWEQYTPYFNDGEPCEFGVYEYSVRVNGEDEYGYESHRTVTVLHEGEEPRLETIKAPKEFKDACKDVKDLITSVDRELMQMTYGDGYEITVHRNGKITTSECDHD